MEKNELTYSDALLLDEIIDAEIIDEIAKVAGVDKKVRQITTRAMNGDLDFKQALKERVKLLKGLPIELIENIVE